MFGLGHSSSNNDNSLESQSFLYSASETLLGSPLLTPDPDPKFDTHENKIQEASFGEYDGLRLYDQYDDSGPSSIQFGDGTGTPEHSESNVNAKGDAPGGAARSGAEDSSLEDSVENGVDGVFVTGRLLAPRFPLVNGNHKDAESSTLSTLSIFSRSPNHPDSIVHPASIAGKSPARTMAANTLGTPDSSKPAPDTPTNRKYSRNSTNKYSDVEFRARSSIPPRLSWMEFARQGILAAYSSRLNPYALHLKEYELLRSHITRPQVTIYLNIRNAILRLWHRNPLVAVTRQEAAGCARESRHFDLSQAAYEWLLRNGYINFGCVDISSNIPAARTKSKSARRKTIVVIGAGMSGLGCARQLEGLIAQLEDRFLESDQKPPKIIILEGRRRIGGRVYSHPLQRQGVGSLPPGQRSTAEMGAQIVTGFDHGNPLNFIIRGQLALPYHALRDNSILYDCDGRIVDKDKDLRVERLWNDILERAAVFRNKLPKVLTVEGERQLIAFGEDAKEAAGESTELLSSLEEAGASVTVAEGNAISNKSNVPEHSSVGVEKLAGRQYQHAGDSAKLAAAEAAKLLGWELNPNVAETRSLDLLPISQSSQYPTLGETMDEGIRQYQEILGLTAQDLRLLNWHHANLEYANAVTVNDLSLGGWDQDVGNEFEGEHSEIIGGYTQVPRGLYQLPTPLDVRFDCAVHHIEYTEEAARDGHRVSIKCTNGQSFEADEVVLTASLGVLKYGSISFNPPLPEWKTSCIERMGFGLLNKVVLVYEAAFWEEDRDIFGLLNDPIQNNLDQKSYSSCRGRFYLFWNCIKTSGRPMLIALMAGAAAHQTEDTDNDSLVREVTERLSTTFAPKKIPRPSEVIVTRWKSDPFARGSYSYVGPRTQQGDYDAMARSCGPIHFAGEATCGTHPATVHGAYLSGLRAAEEVIESMIGPIQIDSGPLVTPRIKTEPVLARSGPKRKYGYVDVWEPINKLDPFAASVSREKEIADYEARLFEAIRAEIGDRPVKPAKATLNPFILFTKDEWQACKAELDLVANKSKPGTKASRTEIRTTLGLKWRNAPPEVKEPYVDRCKEGREDTAEAKADYDARAGIWDQRAAKIREVFVRQNKPPETYDLPASGRKGRKST